MNATEAAFLADIAEHPDDDAPRLVFADWLDDQGRGVQGEFIRMQCELARLDPADDRVPKLRARERRLLSRYAHGWVRGTIGRKLRRDHGGPAWTFSRGMIESLALDAAEAVGEAGRLLSRLPIRRLKLFNFHRLSTLPDPGKLANLVELELNGDVRDLPRQLAGLKGSRPLPRLTRLSIVDNGVSTEAWRGLARVLEPGQLEYLRLRMGNRFGRHVPTPLSEILASPVTSGLRGLEIDGEFADNLPGRLCMMPGVGRIEDLALARLRWQASLRPEEPSQTGLVNSLLRAFRRGTAPVGPSPGLTRLAGGLRRLSLRNILQVGPLGVLDFLGLPDLCNLHTLELEAVSGLRDVAPVLGLQHLARLTTLGLIYLQLREGDLARLLAVLALPSVTTIDLTGNNLTVDDLPAVLDSSLTANLRWLTLRGNPPLGPGLSRLIGSPLVERLVALDLRNTGLMEKDAVRLADRAGDLINLEWLDLRKNFLTRTVRDRLKQAFGTRVELSG